MGRIEALGVAAAALLTPQFARAADLLPPAPPVEPLRGSIVEVDTAAWYIRGDVGAAFNSVSQTSTFIAAAPNNVVPGFAVDQTSIASSGFVTVGAGYQVNNWLRADVTATLRTGGYYQSSESYTSGFTDGAGRAVRNTDNYNANIQSNAFLINGYVDMGTWAGLTPYVGLGVGVATHSVTGLHDMGGLNYGQNGVAGVPGYGTAASSFNANFAWAGMAGVAWNVNKRLKLELGYRYLNMGTANSASIDCQPNLIITNCPLEVQHYKMASHEFHVGMRWMLGGEYVSETSYASGAVLPSSASYAGGGYASGGYAAGGSQTVVAAGHYSGGGYAGGGHDGGGYVGGGAAYSKTR